MRKGTRFLSSAVSFCMALAMTFTMLPQYVSADTTTSSTTLSDSSSTAEVEYATTDGKRTGIKTIKLDGVTYYDVAQGTGETKAEGDQIQFYRHILTDTEASSANHASGSLLSQWASIAEKVFESNYYYSAENNAGGDSLSAFKKNFEERWDDPGYTDLYRALSTCTDEEAKDGTHGSTEDDNTYVSGLTYTSSLSNIRNGAAEKIAAMIDDCDIKSEYSSNKKIFFDATAGDDTMKSLNDDTSQDVYYTMVNCIDQQGISSVYHYNTFVLAFYDFELVPLAAEGLQYISAVQGYDSLKAAQEAGVDGVKITSSDSATDPDTVSSYENKAQESNNVSFTLNESQSVAVSTSFNSSQSFTTSKTLGTSVSVEESFGWAGSAYNPAVAFADMIPSFNLKTSQSTNSSISTSDVIATATTKGKTITSTSSDALTSAISLPAQTTVDVESSSKEVALSLNYDCPVAITYKVAIASMGGVVHVDKYDRLSFDSGSGTTSNYAYKTFSTKFGVDDTDDTEDEDDTNDTTNHNSYLDSIGGSTARANLNKRVNTHRSIKGFEETYGNTYGYLKNKNDNYTVKSLDWSDILSDESVYKNISWLCNYEPLSSTGGTLSYKVKNISASVGEIVPLYPLKIVRMDNNLNIGDLIVSKTSSSSIVGSYVDANTLLNLTLYPGDKFLTNNVTLTGFNKNFVNYYGFKQILGSWKPVKKDADGKWVEDDSESGVASLLKDDVTGNQYVEAGEEEGTYYIQYFINDNTYKSKSSSDYTKNDEVTRPVVRINVKKTPFDGNVTLTGSYTGIVDEDKVNLADELNVLVTDKNGDKVKKEVTWETAQNKGISVTSEGDVTFDKAGTYQVRVCAEGTYSDWLEINAIESANLEQITFTAPEYKKSEVTLTDTTTALDFNLASYLDYFDQYGDEWDGKIPEVSFSLYEEGKGGSISGNYLTVTKAGTYKVYASAEGYHINPITITVDDNRLVESIKVSGSYTLVVGDPALKLDRVLDVRMINTADKEVTRAYTWDVRELKGISVTESGEVKATKAGSYHVRVVNDLGQYSNWCVIKAENPSITLDQSSLTIKAGSTASLKASVQPSNASNKTVSWSSNNSNVSVSRTGVITANKTGSSVITATNAYGSKVICKVKVITPVCVTRLSKSGKSVQVSWTKVDGASGYEIYATHCDGKYRLQKSVSASKFSVKLTKMNGKAFRKDAYKMYVKAYKLINGKKVYLTKSSVAHLQYKKSKKYANATKISLTGNGCLSSGENVQLKAKVKIAKKRVQLNHANAVRYLSSDPTVATVSKAGKVTAKSAGVCYIYAIAIDGVYATKKITVK